SSSTIDRWPWASSKPGISVLPPQSTTRTPRDMPPPALPILLIRPSSTTTRISGLGSLPVQSRRLACSNTTVTPTMYRIASDVQVDQEEVGGVRDQEPQQDSPSKAGRAGHPAADVE